MSEAPMHICEVCFCSIDDHDPCPVDDCDSLSPPCCPGCRCGSFEEYHPEWGTTLEATAEEHDGECDCVNCELTRMGRIAG